MYSLRMSAVLGATLTLFALTNAQAQTGGPFDLSWSTIDGGGATSSGGQFSLSATIGQPDAGRHYAGMFVVGGGFWMGGIVPCRADWNQDGILNSQDFFDFLTAFFSQSADFNLDGLSNSQDLFDFLAVFFEGC